MECSRGVAGSSPAGGTRYHYPAALKKARTSVGTLCALAESDAVSEAAFARSRSWAAAGDERCDAASSAPAEFGVTLARIVRTRSAPPEYFAPTTPPAAAAARAPAAAAASQGSPVWSGRPAAARPAAPSASAAGARPQEAAPALAPVPPETLSEEDDDSVVVTLTLLDPVGPDDSASQEQQHEERCAQQQEAAGGGRGGSHAAPAPATPPPPSCVGGMCGGALSPYNPLAVSSLWRVGNPHGKPPLPPRIGTARTSRRTSISTDVVFGRSISQPSSPALLRCTRASAAPFGPALMADSWGTASAAAAADADAGAAAATAAAVAPQPSTCWGGSAWTLSASPFARLAGAEPADAGAVDPCVGGAAPTPAQQPASADPMDDDELDDYYLNALCGGRDSVAEFMAAESLKESVRSQELAKSQDMDGEELREAAGPDVRPQAEQAAHVEGAQGHAGERQAQAQHGEAGEAGAGPQQEAQQPHEAAGAGVAAQDAAAATETRPAASALLRADTCAAALLLGQPAHTDVASEEEDLFELEDAAASHTDVAAARTAHGASAATGSPHAARAPLRAEAPLTEAPLRVVHLCCDLHTVELHPSHEQVLQDAKARGGAAPSNQVVALERVASCAHCAVAADVRCLLARVFSFEGSE